ncbi:hypothetical protein R1flu_000270 [Riccia fluitans]|uniref:RING-type domain-containing protein n=1 Tax=Riccia fluitans TaxID=41844 RepID=A0ABD1Y005_9MARC
MEHGYMNFKQFRLFEMRLSKHEEEVPQLMSRTRSMADFVMRIAKTVISFLLQALEAAYEATRFLPCLMVLCFSARSLMGPPEFEVDCTCSPEQIRESLKEIQFTAMRDSEDDGCSICLSEFLDGESLYVIPKCNHLFHKACLNQWLLRNKTTCPICRSSLKIMPQFEEDFHLPPEILVQDFNAR